jgi:hypothetical protein
MFFSGNRFPLATPSNIEDHMSFFASALLGRSWSLGEETWVYVDVLLLEDAIVALGLSHSGGAVIEKELQPAVDQSYYSPNIGDPPFGRIRNIPIDPGELQVGLTAPSPKCCY